MKLSRWACAVAGAVVLATTSGVVLAQATSPKGRDPETESRARELAAISADRDRVVREIVDQWRSSLRPANPSLNDDGGLAELHGSLSVAPPEALLAAREAQSYEAVLAAIGARRQPVVVALEPGQVIPNTLGSTSADLVFTPITPCRIVDTRLATGGWAGKIGPAAGNWFSVNLTDFTAQGGAASCPGMPTAFNPAGVAINLTSTGQTGPGNLRVVACGATLPTVSLLNYTPGVSIANAATVSSALGTCSFGPPSGSGPSDIYVYSANSATDVVVDIMGYYAPPVATALECYTTLANSQTVAAGAVFVVTPPACAAGYTQVSIGCRSNNYESANWAITGYYDGGGVCNGTNITAFSREFDAVGRCCRVPGR
jgi:hypothetical protein